MNSDTVSLQQYLPFTVLKHIGWCCRQLPYIAVATVLTVYGIETMISFLKSHLNLIEVATVLTVYGIETYVCAIFKMYFCEVATVLTVYGIETVKKS